VNRLSLNLNQLSGRIPKEISRFTNLEFLYLISNKINGLIPPELGSLSKLKDLRLSKNELTGQIPAEMGNLNKLEVLFLDSNKISGPIPNGILNLPNLKNIDLSFNSFDTLPEIVSIAPFSFFNVVNNKLTFGSLESYVDIQGIKYSPQLPIGEKTTISINQGESYTFFVDVGGQHNHYQWYKDEVIIPEATDASYSINWLTSTDTGDYICHVTNNLATDLTIYSQPIHLYVNKILYGDANGDNILNTVDVFEILKVLSGNLYIIDNVAADYDQDGKVDITDVLQLMEFLSHRNDQF